MLLLATKTLLFAPEELMITAGQQREEYGGEELLHLMFIQQQLLVNVLPLTVEMTCHLPRSVLLVFPPVVSSCRITVRFSRSTL